MSSDGKTGQSADTSQLMQSQGAMVPEGPPEGYYETMMQSAMMQPTVYEAPEVVKAKSIDWTEKQDQLRSRTKADYTAQRTKAKGRADTVLTGSLLDEEGAETTSILAGGSDE